MFAIRTIPLSIGRLIVRDKMRIKGYIHQRPYVITDLLSKGSKTKIEGVILKIQGEPKIFRFKDLKEAKDWVIQNEK